MEDIEPHLRAMSYGHKSNGLVDMKPELESGFRVATKGRVSLEEQADGSLKVIPHYWQEKPDLDAPFHGVLLDDEVKNNLTNGRHAGKVIDLELEQGKLTPCYVSRDKWTNTLEYMPVELLEKRAAIKSRALRRSANRLLRRRQSAVGGLYHSFGIQAGCLYPDRRRPSVTTSLHSTVWIANDYQAENRAIHTQLRAARGEREAKEMGKAPELTIHHMILKAAVPDEAYKQWSQAVKDPSKRADVKAFYIQGWSRTVRANLSTLGQAQLRPGQDGLLQVEPRPCQAAGRRGEARQREPHAGGIQLRGQDGRGG